MDDLIKGGCAMGTKSQQWAINKSLLFNARQGVLTINGKKTKHIESLKPDDIIGLP
jgi:ribosomal protein S2